ncbi:MAG: putative hydrolase [Ilumatobacteraceae bacterium]|nr:putative hydrolase [Ilumatobacteraceae bacterium]
MTDIEGAEIDSSRATIVRGTIVTMDPERGVISDGAVVVIGQTIAAVGSFADLSAAYQGATVTGSADDVVTPGYVNAHQHVTGDRLIHSCIPDAIDSQEAIFGWAVPIHSAHTGDDDELSASLAAVEALTNGVTCTLEAGTVAHPERVADALQRAGMRAMLGQWGWDVDDAPFAAPADEVLDRQRRMLDLLPPGNGLVEAWVTLVGHDLMSDDLVSRASALARERAVGITFHMSPHGGDAVSYLARTGRRPLLHLDDLAALGRHVVIAHGVHLDDAEVEVVLRTETAIAACPWAYLRLAQGVTVAGRHGELFRRGGRLALGCDAENAGDAVDILRAAALFVGLERDRTMDAFSITGHHGLELATIRGAEAVGKATSIGSLEVGKQADIVVHDTSGPQWLPRSTDPVLQLIWASDGRSVREVLVAGRRVVADGRCTTVDVDSLRAEATARRDFLLRTRK